MTTFMKDQKDIQKVYLLGQNYSHGQQVAKYAKEDLKRKRPDIEIVGEDLHPIAQVRDFSPYIAKIKASGADAVITGNWGSDLSLLVKAAVEGGYKGKFYTYYAGVTGTPTALGTNGAGKVYQVAYGHYEHGRRDRQGRRRVQEEVQRRLLHLRRSTASWNRSRPGDGQGQVDRSGEGRRSRWKACKWKSEFGGDVEMRKSDHQLQQPLYMTVWQKAGGKYPVQPREHRHDACAGGRVPELRLEHADELPDEAAFRRPERRLT